MNINITQKLINPYINPPLSGVTTDTTRVPPLSGYVRITENGDTRITESGDTRITEGN